jgi:hypothetical protein
MSCVVPIMAPSVSGSSRFLMRAGRPVIVTDSYHYSDIPENVFVKVHSSMPPQEIEWAVEKILNDYDGYVQRIKEYTEKTSWKNTAQVHLDLYKSVI